MVEIVIVRLIAVAATAAAVGLVVGDLFQWTQ